MSGFRKLEGVLLFGGILLFLAALSIAVFRADQFMLWLGYSSAGKLQSAGKIEKRKNLVRRRFQNSSEFLPVVEEQLVYSRDTIMTGADSGLVLILNDGTLLELGPDTLIEIQFKDEAEGLSNSEFTVKLAKGDVSGDPAHKSVTVVRDNQLIALAPLSKAGLGTEVLSLPPGLKASKVACVVDALKVNSPFELPSAEVSLKGSVKCDPSERTYLLSVKNEKQEVVGQQRLTLNAGKPTEFEMRLPGPGKYGVGKEQVSVPKEYPGILWGPRVINCNRTLAYELPKNMDKKNGTLTVLEEVKNTRLTENDWKKQVHFPVKIQMQFETKDGFIMQSDLASLSTWRDCPTLKHPINRVVFTQNAGALLFTWVQSDASTYRFELAMDPAFKKMLKTEISSRNFSRFSPQKKGVYYWRVESRRNHDLSDVFQFELR